MRSVVLTVLLLVGMVRFAYADEPTDKRVAAKLHYEAGDRAFRLGDYDTAIKEFKLSFSLSGAPLLLYNLGQTYRQMGDVKQALFFYEQFVATGAPGSGVGVQKIAELRAVLEMAKRAQDAPPTGTSANVPAAPPASTIAAAPAPAAVTLTNGPAASESMPVYKKWWLWTIVGVGIAGIAIGVGVGVGDQHKSNTPVFSEVHF